MDATVYPFKWWQYWSLSARLRRAQLNTNLSRVQQKVPYSRFVLYMASVLLVLNPFYWLMNWIFGIHEDFLIFILYSILTSLFLTSAVLYSWIQKYWPTTVKVQVCNSPLYSAGDFIPGKFTDSVELPESDAPDAKKNQVTVEIIQGGTVNHIPPTFAPGHGPFIIAACRFKGEKGQAQSGLLRGLTYYIPAKPEVYVAGDMLAWRGIDWVELVKRHVPGKVNDFSLIILALDAVESETWKVPPDPPGIKMELFNERLRTVQLQARFHNYVAQDSAVREAMKDEGEI